MFDLLLDITVIFAIAVAAAIICHRLNLPTSIGLLVGGVLAGPDAFGLVRNVHEIELLAEVGVVLLLFVIGLEFSLAELKNLRQQFLVGGTIQFFGTGIVIGVATYAMGRPLQQSAYIGFVVALSSTAVVLRMLQERAELDAPHGRLVLAELIYQDIAVVPLMLTAPLLAGAAGGSALGEVGGLLARVAAIGVFAFVAYRWLVPWLLGLITRTRSSEAFLLGVFGIGVGIAVLTQSVGLSLALGAFLAGLIISESDYSHQAVTVMLPFRDVLMSLFFVSIGMLLDIQFLLDNPLLIAALTAGVLVIKPLIATVSGLVVGLPNRSSILAGMSLGQVGEFSLVATTAAVTAGLVGDDVFQTVLDVAVLSMLATPLLFALAPRLAGLVGRTRLGRVERRGFCSARVGAAHAYEDHVVIIGFGVTGQNVARTAARADVPYVVLEMNADTVRDAQNAGEPIHFGDATQETILKHVGIESARAVVIVINDATAARRVTELARRLAPDGFILVRSQYLREVEPLLELGADEVIADELEVSIEVFSRVLSRMLVPREEIKRLIGDVRGDWRRMARTFSREATGLHDLRIQMPDIATHMLRLGQDSPLAGTRISQSRLRDDHEVTILSVTRAGEIISTPRGDFELLAGDSLFVVSPPDWDPGALS